MPREYYQLASLNLSELNRVFESISRRLNYIIEHGNDTSLSGNKIIELAAGANDADAIRKDQAFLTENLAATLLGTTDEIVVTDNGNETLTFSLPPAIKLDGATASRLLVTDASKKTTSVAALSAWIAGTSGRVTVTDDGDSTITLTVPLKANYGLDSDADGLKLKKQLAESAVGAVSAITLNTGTDLVNRVTFNTALITLVSEINDIKTKLNNLLAKLRTAEIIAT